MVIFSSSSILTFALQSLPTTACTDKDGGRNESYAEEITSIPDKEGPNSKHRENEKYDIEERGRQREQRKMELGWRRNRESKRIEIPRFSPTQEK